MVLLSARKTHSQSSQGDSEKESIDTTRQIPKRESQASNSSVSSPHHPRCLYPEHNDFSPPPDGGLRAWLQVLAGLLVMFSTWGFINAFGFFQAHYVTHFNRPPSDISWIPSIQIFIICSLSTVTGRLTDAGYFHWLIIAGFLTHILGIFMASLSTEYWQVLLSMGFCCGIGGALLWCPTVALLSTYFERRRTIALCFVFCGSNLGGVVFTLIADYLEPCLGFAWTVRVMAFVNLLIFALVLVLARVRIPPRKLSERFLELEAFKEWDYVLFTVGFVLNSWAVYFGFFFINSYAKTVLSTPRSTSLLLLHLMNAVAIPGRILPALLADWRLGPVVMYSLFSLFAGITMFAWISVHNLAGVTIFSCFYGFFGAGLQGLFGGAIASLTSNPQKMGVRIGMVCSIGSLASLTGAPLAGALIQAGDGDYLYAQIFGGVCLVLGSLCIFCSWVVGTVLSLG